MDLKSIKFDVQLIQPLIGRTFTSTALHFAGSRPRRRPHDGATPATRNSLNINRLSAAGRRASALVRAVLGPRRAAACVERNRRVPVAPHGP